MNEKLANLQCAIATVLWPSSSGTFHMILEIFAYIIGLLFLNSRSNRYLSEFELMKFFGGFLDFMYAASEPELRTRGKGAV